MVDDVGDLVPPALLLLQLSLPLFKASEGLPPASRQCVNKVQFSPATGAFGECGFDDFFLPCYTGIGTHIDGLAHYGKDNIFYNGVDGITNVDTFPVYNKAYLPSPFGENSADLLALNETLIHQQLKKLGTHQLPPIVTRGVLIDLIPVYGSSEKGKINGTEYILGGTEITPEKIQEALKLQGTTLESGDAVLVHTGWANLFRKDDATFLGSEPGLGEDAARFLTCHEVVLVGMDNWCGAASPHPSLLPLARLPSKSSPSRVASSHKATHIMNYLIQRKPSRDCSFPWVLTKPAKPSTHIQGHRRPPSCVIYSPVPRPSTPPL